MIKARRSLLQTATAWSFCSFACILPVHGVIIAGANGGAGTTNNTTAAQLNAAIGTPFSNFENVIRYSDSSGVYLGFDPNTQEIWVLTAAHVTPTGIGSTIIIDGGIYTQQIAPITVGGVDLSLVKYKNASNLVPTFPAVSLASIVPEVGTEVVMIGWGVDRSEGPSTGSSDASPMAEGAGSGYNWRGDSSANQFLRWGTNNIDTPVYDFGPSDGWYADFDMPGAGEWLTSNEAAGALRDSGSGAFFEQDGKWFLGGIASGVNTLGRSPFTGDPNSQGTYYTDIATQYGALTAAIGATLIPEISTTGLLFAASLLLIRDRRRSRAA